jgi:spermidine synthase
LTRFTALFFTVLTGFSGLVYEVTWQKYLATLLGSQAEATAAVLAIFLGGLSAGYAIFGRVTRYLVERSKRSGRPPRLLLFYALIEAGIGVYATLFPFLFGVAQGLSLLAPITVPGLAFSFDVALSTL